MLHEKECTVTVKLLTEENNTCYATNYVRNEELPERDSRGHVNFKYKVNTGHNTGLDKALQMDQRNRLFYFHSADLSKEDRYENERKDYLNWYQSVIIVPIRCPECEKMQTKSYGFLSVDTMAKHLLNNDHHVVMLSSLAEQMFNFMALMRGDYRISVGDE